MLAPEDEDARACKGDEALLPTVEGIAPTAKARPQPGHEPLPVEGRDVRCPAGGDDEGGVGGDGWRHDNVQRSVASLLEAFGLYAEEAGLGPRIVPDTKKALTILRKGMISLASPRGFEPLSTA